MIDADSSPEHWRLIPFTDGGSAHQLALGEAILESVARGEQPPTLRLYGFSQPTLVLGIAQSIMDVAEGRCRERGITIVRRASGGTAVYHDTNAVSFDLIVPAGHSLGGSDIHRNYARLAAILVRALEALGVKARPMALEESRASDLDPDLAAVCFAARSPYEILASERKLIGLAQRRRIGATMLHGVVYNRFDARQTLELLRPHAEDDALLLRDLARFSSQVTDLHTAGVQSCDPAAVTVAMTGALAELHRAVFCECPLSETELQRSGEFVVERYGNPEWTNRR